MRFVLSIAPMLLAACAAPQQRPSQPSPPPATRTAKIKKTLSQTVRELAAGQRLAVQTTTAVEEVDEGDAEDNPPGLKVVVGPASMDQIVELLDGLRQASGDTPVFRLDLLPAPGKPDRYQATLTIARRLIEGPGGSSVLPWFHTRHPTAGKTVLRRFLEAISAEGIRLVADEPIPLRGLSISPGQAVFTGRAPSLDAFDRVSEALVADPCFVDVKLSKATESRGAPGSWVVAVFVDLGCQPASSAPISHEPPR